MASTSNENQELEKRKQELRDYKTGSKLGLEAFPDAESGEMKNMKVRMALFGMTGSGKSALINTVMKILCGKDEKGVAIEHLPGGEGTTILEEFLPQFNFRLIDTRGFFEFYSSEETEFFRILYGTVREGEVIDRGQMGEVKNRLAGAGGHKLNKPPISDQVHVVLWVVKANDVKLTEDKYYGNLEFVTHKLKKKCITVITVVTFDDTIKPEMRAEVINKAREATKSNKPHCFILANWLSNQDDYDAKYEEEVINMLHLALTCGERSITVRQSKRPRRYMDVIPLVYMENTGKLVCEGRLKSVERYETRYRVDPVTGETGRNSARPENEQNVAQQSSNMEQLQQASIDQEQKLCLRQEQEKQIEELQFTLELKLKLLQYTFGTMIGKNVFKHLDVSDMNKVRIALIGPTGSGKSCFKGTIERTLYGEKKQTNFAQGSGAEGTILLEEYLSWHEHIKLVDTSGFFQVDDATTQECLNIMTGKIKVGEEIHRDYDDNNGQTVNTQHERSAAVFGDQVHGVIFVVKANDPRLTNETYLERMKIISNHFRFSGHSAVTVITYEDKIKSKEERDDAFEKASAATGSPRDRTFFIANYTHDYKKYSLATEKCAVDILDTVLYSAERFVKIQKMRKFHQGNASSSSEQEKPAQIYILIPFEQWSSSTGGIATINRTITKKLAEKNDCFAVCLYVPNGNISLEEEMEAEKSGVTVIYADSVTGIEEPKDKYVWTLFPPDALPKPDIVFGHARFYGPAAHCIRRLSPKTKWVQWVHMHSDELGIYKKEDDAILEGRKRDKAEVKLCEEADAVMAVGPHLAELYESELAYCNKKVNIVNPGIFIEFENVRHRDRDTDPFTVMVFGRGAAEDFEIKGYDIAAKAIAFLGEEYRLIMVGAEPEKIEEMVRKLVEVSDVNGKSLRRGSQLLVQPFCSQKDMHKKFSQADLVLMPSRAEGFGLTALEAISAGVPVLVSKYSGLAKALGRIEGGDDAVVVTDSYEDWASRIEKKRQVGRKVRLEEADTLRKTFGKKYSWTKEAEKLSTILMSLIKVSDDRVPIVIEDDNYSSEETSQVLPQRARVDKKGKVFVPKASPQPEVPEKNMGEKVLAGEKASQSKTKQSQATPVRAPKIKDTTPHSVKTIPTAVGATLEKKQIDPLQGDITGTTDFVSVDDREQKPQSHSNLSACAVSEFPQTDSEYHKKQQYNDQENKSKSYSQAKSTHTTTSGTHVSQQPYDVPQSTKASPYGVKQSGFTKDLRRETKATENVSKHSAAQEVHQKSGREKMKGNEEAPRVSVNVAIIACEVSDEVSVEVALNFISEVAWQQKLNPNIETIKGGNPESLVQNLLKYTENDRQFSHVVLLVDKEVFRNISTDKRKLTSYTYLMEEIQFSAGTQAILIVCNDKDHIPHDQVHSKSVGNFLKQVTGISKLDESRWITLSWNEYDENFSLEKHIQYLVKGEYEAGPRHKNTATTREEVYYAPDLSENHEGHPMDYSMDVDPMVPSNASQGRSPNVEDKGNIVWEGRIESGKLITTYMRPGWKPPDGVYQTVCRDNRHKSYAEFRVKQSEEGSFKIISDSDLKGMSKAFVKGWKRFYR